MDLLTQGQRIVARDSRLMLINREIISQAYWDSMAGEINEKLQECSQIFLAYSLLLIQPLIEDAKARQLTDKAVRCLLVWLKDAIYDAEDILDEAKTHELLIQRKAELSRRPRSKVRELFSLDYNPLLFKLQLGKKLRNVNERINELNKEMYKFKLRVVENNSKPLGNRPQTYSYVHESQVVIGRDKDKEKLVQMLIRDSFDEKVVVVSVVGIWHVGKIIHTASGKKCNHTNMEVLQRRLRKELGQKRYLLVLDDVWNEDVSATTLLLA
ncbi:putative disease resistance protein RGA3 [Dioscorea cayenensis subsp. rotundata]|uniref:Disease resistance protein RGA3 n=1 Tax=Dioscorea cayennensis subsp. rotundata TaxID=55577 RepID=A0AB40BPY5_DIOCR|nr:putative disease resistance protein RGA3 [Dioscorea cayenensis subsp. rotundata]